MIILKGEYSEQIRTDLKTFKGHDKEYYHSRTNQIEKLQITNDRIGNNKGLDTGKPFIITCLLITNANVIRKLNYELCNFLRIAFGLMIRLGQLNYKIWQNSGDFNVQLVPQNEKFSNRTTFSLILPKVRCARTGNQNNIKQTPADKFATKPEDSPDLLCEVPYQNNHKYIFMEYKNGDNNIPAKVAINSSSQIVSTPYMLRFDSGLRFVTTFSKSKVGDMSFSSNKMDI
jgi:hypothetical protein